MCIWSNVLTNGRIAVSCMEECSSLKLTAVYLHLVLDPVTSLDYHPQMSDVCPHELRERLPLRPAEQAQWMEAEVTKTSK